MKKEKDYEITSAIKKAETEDLILILEGLNEKLNSNEIKLEESIKIFEFAKQIEILVTKKLKEIEFKFSEILVHKDDALELEKDEHTKKDD